jgi:hypothetical protein
VNPGFRTFVAREAGRCRARCEQQLFPFAGDALDRKRYSRIRDVKDCFNVLVVYPASRDDASHVGLVLMIAGDDFDLAAQHRALEVLDSHLGGDHRSFAAVVGVER